MKYEAIGCGVYEVDPPPKFNRCPYARAATLERAHRIADVLNGHEALLEALRHVEDILGFHEGSEEKVTETGKPVIWINAQGKDGDFQIMLAKVRAAIASIPTEVPR